MSCIDASVVIVKKSPKVGPLLIFSISPAHTNSMEGGGGGRRRQVKR
jgi:hypothetical protein